MYMLGESYLAPVLILFFCLERIEEKVEEERPRNPDYQSKLD